MVRESPSVVTYQGQQIEVARTHLSFDEYKNDPANLTADQLRRVELLVRKALFGPVFDSEAEFDQALWNLQFPGFGLFYANQLGAKIHPSLELVYVEIPARGLNRYLSVERQSDGAMHVVEDFVAPSQPEITRVDRNGAGQLQYRGTDGEVIVPVKQ